MDRIFFYPGELMQDTDLLNMEKNTMIGLGAVLEMMLGANQIVSGFTCSALPNNAVTGAAFAVSISRGFMTSYQEVDPNAFGSVGTDTARNVMKCGVNLSSSTVALTNAGPNTSGQAINYLISAGFSEGDTEATVLPYVNAANPSQPYSGQNNTGTTQNTVRQQSVVFEVTAGAAANAGTQTTPAAPAGYVPLFVVTITNGDAAVQSGEIAQSPLAPIIPHVLQSLSPGFSTSATLTAAEGNIVVPAGVTRMRLTALGGGGGGGGAAACYSAQISAGNGGQGSGTAILYLTVTPGQVIPYTIGAGGVGGAAGQPGGVGGGTNVAGMNVPGGQGGVSFGPTTTPTVATIDGLSTSPSGATVIKGGSLGGPAQMLAIAVNGVAGGGGGESTYGAGAGISSSGTGYAGSNTPSHNYGTGGGGACCEPSGPGYAGAAGAQGVIVVEF
jgi:hypothetical protein